MKKLARASLSPAPLIYTSDLNSPANSAPQGADMKVLETPETAGSAANLTSEGTPEEAKVKANRKLFGRFFCCLCVPKTKETTSR